jgi:hypothetical protein
MTRQRLVRALPFACVRKPRIVLRTKDSKRYTEKLGKGSFFELLTVLRCSRRLQRGVAMLHSFWWPAGRAYLRGSSQPRIQTVSSRRGGYASNQMYNTVRRDRGATPEKCARAPKGDPTRAGQMSAATQRREGLSGRGGRVTSEDFANQTERQRALAPASKGSTRALAAKYPKDDESADLQCALS